MHKQMKIMAVVAGVLLSGQAVSAAQIFSGQDDGAAIGSPYVNSRAAEAAFLAAAGATGTVHTETFENAPTGYYSPVVTDGLSISFDMPDLGSGFSGVNSSSFGSTYGFNTTEGGSKWLGFPGIFGSSATFQLSSPSTAFGFYTTGVQNVFTASITLGLLDGSETVFNLPLNQLGGVSYFGIVDTTGFTSVKINQVNYAGYVDLWGVDDISFVTTSAPVPEPQVWMTLIAGFGMVGWSSRRRRKAAIA